MPEQAKIPEHLGKCDIIHVHDDGDLTIQCSGVKYVVTTEGEIFREIIASQEVSMTELLGLLLSLKVIEAQLWEVSSDLKQVIKPIEEKVKARGCECQR